MTDTATTTFLRPLDPGAHPLLIGLGERLTELAGETAYVAGRDYLKKGLVRHTTVAGTTAHATVTGATDYRVSVKFAVELAEPVVTCSCPAHRRSRHCKHVVAVVVALLERPGDFTPVAPVDLPPEATTPKRRRSSGSGTVKERAASRRSEQQSAGLAVVDRLIDELAEGGIATLGSEGAALLAEAAETVRALKLRRLGNRLMALQRLVGPADTPVPLSIAQALALLKSAPPGLAGPAGSPPRPDNLDGLAARFADLLVDVSLTRQTLGARADGRGSVEPALAEDLLGKTWRDADLAPVSGLDLFPLGDERIDDGEFKIETSYLLDLTDGSVYVERQITPRKLRSPAKPVHRDRLLVDEAGRYPGEPPHRLKLVSGRRAALTVEHVDRALALADTEIAALRARLIERLRLPFEPAEVTGLFRPTALLRDRDSFAALDRAGRFLPLVMTGKLGNEVRPILPEPGRYALFGRLGLSKDPGGVAFTVLSVVGELLWGNGPVFPNVGG
jgi:hypothetical protein